MHFCSRDHGQTHNYFLTASVDGGTRSHCEHINRIKADIVLLNTKTTKLFFLHIFELQLSVCDKNNESEIRFLLFHIFILSYQKQKYPT